MGHYIFFFFVIFITLVAFSSGADREFLVKIHERCLLPCSVPTDPRKLKHIDWYRCSPNLKKDSCANDGKMVMIAQVKFMREREVFEQNFDVYTNGTLVIKKALPMDDGIMFKCSALVRSIGRENFTAILNIAREPPKLISSSSRTIRVIKGMDLTVDVQVQGYPYPWVTWSHNGLPLPNTLSFGSETKLKMRNVTVLDGGLYSCYAKNPLGHDNLTFNVNVEVLEKSFIPIRPNFPTNLGQLVTTPAASDFQTSPSSLTSDFQTPPSSVTSDFQTPPSSVTSDIHTPPSSLTSGKEDGAVFIWSTWIYPALLIFFDIVTICLVLCLYVKIKSIQDCVNRMEIPPVRNRAFNASSGDGDEHAQTQEGNIEFQRAS
ncbi:neural cell adhesion molecule 1-like isoform X4 [Pocillopora verrucosa]|uniref:neural cell adhesion molecule 1-like isoform X4 n=1 Tax=Pocillopora verrucosa TaxID=203993 RepID=UPI0033426235